MRSSRYAEILDLRGTSPARGARLRRCVKFAVREVDLMLRLARTVFVVATAFAAAFVGTAAASAQTPATFPVTEGDYVAHNFKFRSGEELPGLRLHYRTLGQPDRDARGQIKNGILILHGTGGSGAQFLSPQFANEVYGPGQLLDITRYYIVLPDGIGHGKSSKPSDGLHAHFPQYDYDDMVAAQHLLVEQ